MGVSLSRETYISKKGNFYLMPELGAAIHNATVTKLGDEELKEEDQFQISSLYINGTLGFGRHFGPMTSFIAKLGFNTSITEPSVQDLEGNDYSNQLATSQKEGSLFEYIGGGGLFSMGLRFRF
jgi:hypothetical protein